MFLACCCLFSKLFYQGAGGRETRECGEMGDLRKLRKLRKMGEKSTTSF